MKQVLLEDDNTIHFGEVLLGAKQCRPIHLINRGRAQVPIRIIISAVSCLTTFGIILSLHMQVKIIMHFFRYNWDTERLKGTLHTN